MPNGNITGRVKNVDSVSGAVRLSSIDVILMSWFSVEIDVRGAIAFADGILNQANDFSASS